MPWNNQSGGSGGNEPGPGGPWSRGPSGGGTPDFDELLKRTQERVRQLLPTTAPPRGTWAALGLALVAVWLLSGIYFVSSHEQGFVMRFGRVVAHSVPGMNYHLPRPIETDKVAPVESENQLAVGYQLGTDTGDAGQAKIDVPAESLMLTADGNIADVNFTVHWYVRDASAYLFNADGPKEAVKAVAESAMREVVGQSRFDAINTDRQAIAARVRRLMQNKLDLYDAGIAVSGIQLGKVSAPEPVSKADGEIEAARSAQDSLRNDAEVYADKTVLDARGQAAKIIQDAEAYRQQAIAEANGEAKRFLSVYQEYRKAPEVTRRRMYLETMSQVLGPMNKVILDEQASHSVLPTLALPEVSKSHPENVTVTPPASNPPQVTQGPKP
jgi:membrane protease subunit HflK